MNKPIQHSRRQFLKQSGALSAMGVAGGSWLMNLAAMSDAAAADGSGYKALVCVFLYGGNDACNTVLPLDSASWARYDQLRNKQPDVTGASVDLRLDLAKIRRITTKVGTADVTYGLHDRLPKVQSLYNSGKLAVLANVGTMMVSDVRGADFNVSSLESNMRLPPKLRSHNDQQTEWQSGRSNFESIGTGGRVVGAASNLAFTATGDVTDKANSFRSMYMGDSAVFAFGDDVPGYGLTDSGDGVVALLADKGGKLFNGVPVGVAQDLITGLTGDTSSLIAKDYADLTNRSITAQKYLSAKLSGVTVDPAAVLPAGNDVATRLELVARIIKAHAVRGNGRQVFFVPMYGFDSHDNQRNDDNWYSHDNLMGRLDDALSYFNQALGTNSNVVTTFTASEFGRQLVSNGDGTDHGWGGHHFIMGGAVKGGQVYGRVPSYAYSDTTGYVDEKMTSDGGAMIPVVSVGSYCATLARWFGLTDAEVKGIFPYLFAEGGVSSTNVGFMNGVV
jgi:uncharacterized protein (DUF1501 family)